MYPLLSDKLFRKHWKDIVSLKKSRRKGFLRYVVVFLAVIIVAITISSKLHFDQTNGQSLLNSRSELLKSGVNWGQELIERQDFYRLWLEDHGTAYEVRIFDYITSFIFELAAPTAEIQRREDGDTLLGNLTVAVYFASLRVAFVVLACSRLWLFAMFIAACAGVLSLKVYKGQDLLGQTGNSRLFYSGALGKLNLSSVRGASETHITGLACLKQATANETKHSDLGRLLQRFAVDNPTNLALAAMILAYPECPAYVARQGEEKLLSDFFENVNLAENTFLVLEKALSLHARYKVLAHGELAGPSVSEILAQGKIAKHENSHLLEKCLHRVLSGSMREELARIPAREIACIVLACEASKIMTYSQEGSEWLRKSSFQHLCARAVLHSIPQLTSDYNPESRLNMRRALIFAARNSPFGPVRFPVDFSVKARTLRQWVELLMACPHELQAVADEVELFGITSEFEHAWSERFLGGVASMNSDCLENVFASQSNLLFMPLKRILKLSREILSALEMKRLEELVLLVSQRQKLRNIAQELTPDADKESIPFYERVFSPLSFSEISKLAELHQLTIKDVKDWSALRVAFDAFGWLGSRVGDYSVPESSIIFAVFSKDEPSPEAKYFGHAGMVALRSTRLEAKWGRYWQSRFSRIETASMAESKERYEKLLAGERDSVELLDDAVGSPSM